MRKGLRIVAIMVIISAVLLSVGCSKEDPEATVGPQQPKADPTVEVFGIVKAKEASRISLGFEATVDKVHVNNGQQLNKGEAIITLDMTDALGQLNQEQIAYAKLKNELARARLEQESAQLNIDSANNALEWAQKKYEGHKALLETEAISEQDFYQVEQAYEQAQVAAVNAKATAQNLANSINQLESSVTAQAKQLASLRSKLYEAPYLEGDRIVAPADQSVVYDLQSISGDHLASKQVLLSIMDQNSLIAAADVPEEFVKDIELGAEATIVPLANPQKEYHGTVISIAAMAQRNNGEVVVPVEVSIDDIDEFLLPNFNVDVSIKKVTVEESEEEITD